MFDPATKPGAGARPGRVTHCCFEHAGQNFGSLDRGPRAIRLKCRYGWRTSELKSKSSRKRNPVDPVAEEIPDAEHELVIERVAAIDVAKASGTVCLRLAGKSGRRVSRVWDVQAVTGAVAGLADQLTEVGVRAGHRRVHVGLLADLVLPAGGGRARRAAGQRPRREERARQAENGQTRRSLAGQVDREGAAAAVLRASGTDPATA